MVKNALQYNSDPTNPYHLAAKSFRIKFHELIKPLNNQHSSSVAILETQYHGVYTCYAANM